MHFTEIGYLLSKKKNYIHLRIFQYPLFEFPSLLINPYSFNHERSRSTVRFVTAVINASSAIEMDAFVDINPRSLLRPSCTLKAWILLVSLTTLLTIFVLCLVSLTFLPQSYPTSNMYFSEDLRTREMLFSQTLYSGPGFPSALHAFNIFEIPVPNFSTNPAYLNAFEMSGFMCNES